MLKVIMAIIFIWNIRNKLVTEQDAGIFIL